MDIIFKVKYLDIMARDFGGLFRPIYNYLKFITKFSAGSGACYFPGRSADVFLWGEKVGSMGVIHPNTLKAFELPNPVSVLELNLEPFL